MSDYDPEEKSSHLNDVKEDNGKWEEKVVVNLEGGTCTEEKLSASLDKNLQEVIILGRKLNAAMDLRTNRVLRELQEVEEMTIRYRTSVQNQALRFFISEIENSRMPEKVAFPVPENLTSKFHELPSTALALLQNEVFFRELANLMKGEVVILTMKTEAENGAGLADLQRFNKNIDFLMRMNRLALEARGYNPDEEEENTSPELAQASSAPAAAEAAADKSKQAKQGKKGRGSAPKKSKKSKK